jgi:uncharacterized protein YkwD
VVRFLDLRRIAALVSLACVPVLTGNRPSDAGFDQRILAVHNDERLRLGVPALRWSPELAASARVWADHLQRTGQFEHSPDQPGQDPEGENLWAGTKGNYELEDMVGLWVSERADYKPGVFPNNSRSGHLESVGHYTQLIWRETHSVGCATARGEKEDFLVCRYSAAGNVFGERPV